MKTLQTLSDKTAIGLSLLCTLHCLALPVILVVFPSIAALQLDNEKFHLWMIVAVIPTSIYALTLGCKQHKQPHVLAAGAMGLLFLILAVVIDERLLGDIGERMVTLIGAGFIALGHYRNYRLCQQHANSCKCSEHKTF